LAISKSLRFQILRRDGFKCRYCGLKAAETELVIEHVVPVALGGKDEPSNLVASCRDCNTGKAAIPPDAPLVAQVEADALRWAKAISVAADRMLNDLAKRQRARRAFDEAWNRWHTTGGRNKTPIPRPDDWETAVDRFIAAGLPAEILIDCLNKAMTTKKVKSGDVFRYMCGIAWRKVSELQEQARELVGAGTHYSDGTSEDDAALYDRACKTSEELDISDTEVAYYMTLAEGVNRWIGKPVANELVLAVAIAVTEIGTYGRRLDLMRKHLQDLPDGGERAFELVRQEWEETHPGREPSETELLLRAIKIVQEEEKLEDEIVGGFFGLTDSQQRSWEEYCKVVYPESSSWDKSRIFEEAARIAYEFKHNATVPPGMCCMGDRNEIGACFNRASSRVKIGNCPRCSGECTFDHQVCEGHRELLVGGRVAVGGEILAVEQVETLAGGR